jgi:2-polyprenyl-3-methyl-5-hydroxy-6-metoxy-1,4-benzoquinol methylase
MTTTQLDKEYWDRLYQREEYVYGTEPNQYLLEHASFLRSGMKALAVGDGEGRNGVWLATRGLLVVSAERSRWGVKKARRLARQRRVELTLECCDLLEWSWPREEFDVVVAMYLHTAKREREMIHRNIRTCLKPGGLIFLEAFRQNHAASVDAGFRRDESLFTTALLRQDFYGFEFIELLERTVALNEGCMHQGTGEIVRLLARKPMEGKG